MNSLESYTMRTERDDLLFMVRLSLRKGMSLIRGMKRVATEEQEKRIAEIIINELEHNNWSIRLKEPSKQPSI
jgi:hypothetical protein